MRILKAVEGSVLWLSDMHSSAMENLRRRAAAAGIDPDRLVFAARQPSLADHLARHRLADLFLDTLPYNAHTTASDALWAGLPVLTQSGDNFAGRVAASLLSAAGLPDLIVKTAEDFERLAIDFARTPAMLEAMRERVARARVESPLFKTELFTRHLEDAYAAMLERARNGLPPDHIDIEDER
jgi:predicted O-linked N-acetylglucosamine transferase (SPINDLY family)